MPYRFRRVMSRLRKRMLPEVGRKIPVTTFEARGLPRFVRADEGPDGAGLDVHVQLLHRGEPAEVHRHAFQFKQDLGHAPPPHLVCARSTREWCALEAVKRDYQGRRLRQFGEDRRKRDGYHPDDDCQVRVDERLLGLSGIFYPLLGPGPNTPPLAARTSNHKKTCVLEYCLYFRLPNSELRLPTPEFYIPR